MEEKDRTELFMQEILDSIDSGIFKYYQEKKASGNPYFKNTYENAVYDVIASYFTIPINFDNMTKVYRKNRDYKAKKKKRWAENLMQYAACSYEEKKYPFREIANFKLFASADEWKERFGDFSYEEVIEQKIKEVEQWKFSKNAKMTDFPIIEAFSKKSAYAAFETDVFFEAYNVIYRLFDRTKNKRLRSYVLEMGDAPYFTTSRKKYDLAAGTGEIPMSEDGSSKLVFQVNQEFLSQMVSLKMMDAKDMEILNYLLDVNPESLMRNLPIVVETAALAKIVAGNDRPSSLHYDEAEKRCFQMANITYNKFVDDKQIGAINWIDSVIKRNIEGKRYVEIVLGSRLVGAAITNKISRLPSPAYEKLSNSNAKLLYLPLQKRRILIFQRYDAGEVEMLKTTFTYNDFLMMINFGSGRKAKNYNTICEAFQEYVDKKEVIEHYDTNCASYTIDVYFYPLTDEEKRSMKDYNILNDKARK